MAGARKYLLWCLLPTEFLIEVWRRNFRLWVGGKWSVADWRRFNWKERDLGGVMAVWLIREIATKTQI